MVNRFETARLVAERLSASDLADLTALHLDPDVSATLGGVRSPEQTAAYLPTNLASRRVMEKSGLLYERAYERDGEPLLLYRRTV